MIINAQNTGTNQRGLVLMSRHDGIVTLPLAVNLTVIHKVDQQVLCG